ncbi:hypothetical protein JCM8097_006554 [Rhodosporidiobolus ruineniae]
MAATRNPRRGPRTAASPPSDRAAPPSLHQRILFPPGSTATPPRILHSAAHDTLDPLALDLVALALRAYVTPWYNGAISRDPDKAFLQAVTAVLISVIQALEVRLTALDWTELVVSDLPALLAQHYRDWDLAVEKAAGGTAHNLSPDAMFHHLQPHIAISLVAPAELSPSCAERVQPQVDKVYLRTLVDHLLKLLLPPADYRAETERAIVREIVASVVFGTVFNRVAQSWFLHGIIAKQLEAREAAKKTAEPENEAQGSPSDDAILDKLVRIASYLPAFAASAWSTLFTLPTVASSITLPPSSAARPPLFDSLLSLLLAIFPSSTFLTQTLHYLSLPLSFFPSFADALLVHSVTTRLATAATVQAVLEGAIKGMFPNDGWPAPKEPDPDEEQQEELKRWCEEALARALPANLPSLIAANLPPPEPGADPRLPLARHLLRPLSSHVANVHLFLLVVDLVVGKVFPELLTPHED